MSIRGVGGKSPFDRSQKVFDFMQPEVGRMAKRSEERIRKKNRKSEKRKLLSWMDMDVTEIPDDVLLKLDELILQRKKVIQSNWTVKDEADRRGVDVRDISKLAMSEGRLFESQVSYGECDLD